MAKTKIYFWLKIDKKFFDNIFIKRLKTVPGGYTMTVIYIRLMLESLESDCILYYEGYFDNLKEELALKLDVSEDDIDMTMAYFTKCGLIQVDEDKNAELPQAKALVESETNWANYKREQRKKAKLEEVQPSLTISNSCPTEIEKELEEEIEKKTSSAPTAEISNYYQKRIGVMDGQQYQILTDYLTLDGMELEVIKIAVDKAADNGKRSFSYINSILKNWRQNGIRTMVQVEDEQRLFQQKKQGQSDDDIQDPFIY
ncbi:DnaD domain protein [Streptococcus pneumoniae]|uniref:Replication protein n=1 Tax=Streptococcus pneumoniae TaxID=1313 RepID=A0AA95IJU6_STREE|nr:DnaD domain protein [Streptococcus pneumoniae]MDS2575137.1 DnaD domain protein [Streptococcus pneumoniae]MDS2653658.1 DnaD domain protein [Streptococcus pneumoniae]MDS2763857.1 DnaD domain protein [Streptococcus pneumoniae]MDS3356528.1 DnaD domain protein [Streptococcus pneumoniae]